MWKSTRRDLEAVSAAGGEQRRGEVAEAVDREDRRLLERRHEERAGRVCLVVLDVVELGAHCRPESPLELAVDVADPPRVLQPRLHVARPGAQGAQELRPEVRPRVARDGDVVEVARLDPGVGKAPARGLCRKPRAMLDPVEPLLLGGRDELAVEDERGCRVTVVGVQAEDRRHGVIFGQ